LSAYGRINRLSIPFTVRIVEVIAGGYARGELQPFRAALLRGRD
jgi:hypothetical protein